MNAPTCPYCSKPSVLTNGAEIYKSQPQLSRVPYWICRPCDAYVGCHRGPECEPLGRLANGELRELKKSANAAMDELRKRMGWTREGAISWLSRSMNVLEDSARITRMDENQCRDVIQLCQDKARASDTNRARVYGGMVV